MMRSLMGPVAVLFVAAGTAGCTEPAAPFVTVDTTPQHLFLRFAPGPIIVCLHRRGLPLEVEAEILERKCV